MLPVASVVLGPYSAETTHDEEQKLTLLDLIFDTTSTFIKLKPRKMETTSSPTDTRVTTSPFLDLPAELRVLVYEEVFRMIPFNPDTPKNSPLLTVSKLVRKESSEVYKAHLIRIMNRTCANDQITNDYLTRIQANAPSVLERWRLLQVLKAVVTVSMEHQEVYEAELTKLLLGTKLGGEYTLERKLKRLTDQGKM